MGRREEQKAQRQRAIFEAAIRLFRERGFAETTVEEIAAAADIAKGTFFNYFSTKEAVLLHLNELQVARIQPTVEGIAGFDQLPVAEQVGRIFDALAEGIDGQQELVRVAVAVTLLHAPAHDEAERQIQAHFDQLLVAIAARGQARGELRADASTEELGLMFRQIYFLTVLDWLQQPARDLAPMLRRSLTLLLEGLKGPNRG